MKIILSIILTSIFITFFACKKESKAVVKDLEPTIEGAVGLHEYILDLSNLKVTSLETAFDVYGGTNNIFQRKIPSVIAWKDSKTKARYLYSPKWGWIDMVHFTAATWTASLSFVSVNKTISQGEWNEYKQEQNKSNSAWDYEDLISNFLGAHFYLHLKERPNISYLENLTSYFTDLGFTNKPLSEAPNAHKLPKNEGTETGQTSKLYIPRFTKAKIHEFNSFDNKIIEAIVAYSQISSSYLNSKFSSTEDWKKEYLAQQKLDLK